MPYLTDIARAFWKEETNPRSAKIWKRRLRFTLAAFSGVIFAGWLAMLASSSGSISAAGQWITDSSTKVSLELGFKVTEIAVNGRHHTRAEDILASVNTPVGSPILAFDPDAARTALEQLPWIEKASVMRRLPGQILIDVTERAPIALWQINKKISLIDKEGKVLTSDIPAEFKKLPLIVGSEAPKAVSEIVSLLAAEPEIAQRLDAAVRIGNRRWDLRLKNGIDVKLPEENIGYALRRLAARQQEAKLLDRGLAVIDLRLEDKMTVRPEKTSPETGDKKQKSI